MSFDATRMTRLRRLQSLAVAPCRTYAVVAADRLSDDESKYISDLWRVSLEDPSAPPVQLTFGDCNDRRPRFRRDGALAFLSNRSAPGAEAEKGASERNQVWLIGPEGGEPRQLTDEPLGVSDMRFARAGDRLLVIADVLPGVAHDQQRETAREQADKGPTGLLYRRMPIRHWDHWRPRAVPHLIAYDERGQGRRDLTPDAIDEHRGSELGVQWDLAADGSRAVIILQTMGPDRLDELSLRVIDVDSGATRDLGHVPRVELMDPMWSPDGSRIACARNLRTDGAAGKPELWVFDVASGAGTGVAPTFDSWPSVCGWTDDGQAVIALADWRGCRPLFRFAVDGGEVSRLSAEAAGGCHNAIEIAGERAIGLRHRMHHPPEVFRMALVPEASPELMAPLSGFSEDDGRAVATWESIEVAGDDGAPVQSFVVTPAGKAGPRPALIWIHGGPMGQHVDGWHWRWNPLIPAAAGYVVALPNPRGSTGFGQDFVEGIWNNQWGAACYTDLMRVTDAVAARDDVDGDRIGAMGGSFGGYMANWIGGQTDRFGCLMTHAGLYHLSGFYGTTDYPAYCIWENGFSPYERADEYDRYSPHKFVHQWKTPTLVIHGEKDYRVPISEALMLFEALQLHGVDSELLVFPDENHWIARPRNTRQWYAEVIAFADRHLRT